MKWLGGPSLFPLFTNPCVINWFIFGQEVVIYCELDAIKLYIPRKDGDSVLRVMTAQMT